MSQPLEQYYVPCPFVPGDIVWSYLRYSTDDQSIASQELAVREWCKQHQLNLARVFIDEAKSGKNTAGRDQFLLMIQLLQDSHLSPRPAGVVFWNMARFARDYDDAQFYKASLRRLGYILHSMTDQIPPGRVGRIVESIKDFANAEEAIQRSLEAKRGLWERAKQGFNTGGFPPRGYKRSAPISLGRKKNGEERLAYRWEIDPGWESRVRKAWQMRLAGQNLHAIHRETRIFNAINSYVSMFSNITYAGYRKCGEMLVPNAHDAYVTKEEFDRVQRMRRATPGNPKSPKGDPQHSRRQSSPFLLSGILYCGICGAAMVGDRDQ
jgi:site-specific DNA recombinase